MPFADPMTWVPSESRWVKRISKPLKKSFYFAPKKHGVEATEDGSRGAMRSWWAAQEAILNAAVSENEKELARGYLSVILKLHPLSEDAPTVHVEDTNIARALVITEIEGGLSRLSESLTQFMPQAADMLLGPGEHDRLKTLANEIDKRIVKPVDRSKLIGTNIDRWLEMKEAQVKSGNLSEGSLRIYTGHMDSLGDAHGKELVEAITSDWIEARFKELAHLDLSPPTKANRWQCWKIFFEYLDVNGLIEKPKNLKTWKFSHDAKEIKSPWTVEEYQAALQVASGAKRLCLLLAANCSFYASDICASFQHFDAKTGTIRMSRIKTQKKCKPVVYYLWAETTESMKNHGKELERMYNIIKKWRFPTPMKQLRHTTKSFLMNSAYSQFTAYMTGEKGGSINEQWYWTKEHNPIKKAVCFLHSCYFPKTTDEP